MAFQFTFLVLFALFIASEASFGLGKLPLNAADDVNGMRPSCPVDRFGTKYVPCPFPDSDDLTIWPCVKMSDLCNGRFDCPNGEDETAVYCFYHNFRVQQLDVLRKELDNAKKLAL